MVSSYSVRSVLVLTAESEYSAMVGLVSVAVQPVVSSPQNCLSLRDFNGVRGIGTAIAAKSDTVRAKNYMMIGSGLSVV
jgi:hypothetical protein